MRPIDADVLMEEVLKGTIISDDLYGMGIMAGVDSFAKKLKAAPTLALDDLRPKGRWEVIEDYVSSLGYTVIDGYRCSLCKEESREALDFCGHCGADMRGYMSDGQRNQEG